MVISAFVWLCVASLVALGARGEALGHASLKVGRNNKSLLLKERESGEAGLPLHAQCPGDGNAFNRSNRCCEREREALVPAAGNAEPDLLNSNSCEREREILVSAADNTIKTGANRKVVVCRIILVLSTIVYAASYSNTVTIQRVLDPGVCTALRFLISCVPFLPNVIHALFYAVRLHYLNSNNNNSNNSTATSTSTSTVTNNKYKGKGKGKSKYYKVFTQGIELGAWMSLAFGAQGIGLQTASSGKVSFISALGVVLPAVFDAIWSDRRDSHFHLKGQMDVDIDTALHKRKKKMEMHVNVPVGRTSTTSTGNDLGIAKAVMRAVAHWPFSAPLLALSGVLFIEFSSLEPPNTSDLILLIPPIAFALVFWRSERMARKRDEWIAEESLPLPAPVPSSSSSYVPTPISSLSRISPPDITMTVTGVMLLSSALFSVMFAIGTGELPLPACLSLPRFLSLPWDWKGGGVSSMSSNVNNAINNVNNEGWDALKQLIRRPEVYKNVLFLGVVETALLTYVEQRMLQVRALGRWVAL